MNWGLSFILLAGWFDAPSLRCKKWTWPSGGASAGAGGSLAGKDKGESLWGRWDPTNSLRHFFDNLYSSWNQSISQAYSSCSIFVFKEWVIDIKLFKLFKRKNALRCIKCITSSSFYIFTCYSLCRWKCKYYSIIREWEYYI